MPVVSLANFVKSLNVDIRTADIREVMRENVSTPHFNHMYRGTTTCTLTLIQAVFEYCGSADNNDDHYKALREFVYNSVELSRFPLHLRDDVTDFVTKLISGRK